jgi:hypothetical protein
LSTEGLDHSIHQYNKTAGEWTREGRVSFGVTCERWSLDSVKACY